MTIHYKELDINNIRYFTRLKELIDADLSEPYSIYVYRYFLNQWPELAYLAFDSESTDDLPIGCIICKNEIHRNSRMRGYIGMLAVQKEFRGQGIAKKLVGLAIDKMISNGCDEIMLETEVENMAALNLYERLGFIRMKRMFRYYLNEGDAFKLILPITERSSIRSTFLMNQDPMVESNTQSNLIV
ncbi:similar to Saccharomyces cerevisiae YPR051W MAK3 Catalytic subunit of N-terminal acetyltransferase of the NatC type [Maudiozyma saulgeensis]|uniref:Similar to Saccharomyces cerevisiae YPR051W MAK3 Catalytic subunit of N-terminal acetyltransferase of the NatC type n=1 Tax=Maudiozyma saulgeensis TaxID=1789683 RepID=A0A1X7R3U5_9SACH|nr:similar to Saccharomyces cerevisiae YPR051W MAK3 Catalytic subunit of N-terminal acetyltransferase of the NatC type [Kazachstania saulgeensis]